MNQAPTVAQLSSSDEVLNSHMQYWYDLLFRGVRRGQDAMVMVARIEVEQKEIPDELGVEIRREWEKQLTDDDEGAMRSALISSGIRHHEYRTWVMNNERSLENQQQQQVRVHYNERLDRDLDRLLADKEQNMRIHLSHLEGLMIKMLREGRMNKSRSYHERLGKLWSKLRKEEKANGVVSAPLQDEIIRVPNQRRQSIEVIDAAALAVNGSGMNFWSEKLREFRLR